MAKTKLEPLQLSRAYSDEEARANLADFTKKQDRGHPPVFVGREEIIDRVVRGVARCRAGIDGSACYTLVICGAPGVGKTSLLEEIKKRLSGGLVDRKRIDKSVVVTKLSGHDLSDKGTVVNEIVNAYSGHYLDLRTEGGTVGTLRAEPVAIGGTVQRGKQEKSLSQQAPDSGKPWHLAASHAGFNKADTTLLLLIDEAQNMQGDAGSGPNRMAIDLHSGFDATQGVKIVPVFAGLSDTETVLAERGVSRLGSDGVIRLGSLTQSETEELVTEWMQQESFGFDELFKESDVSRASKIIAVASEGWACHANAYLKGLGEAILDQGLKPDLEINFDDVLEKGHDDRLRYYRQRLAAADLGRYEDAVSDAARLSTDGIVDSKAIESIAHGDHHLKMEDVDQGKKKAIHAGVLEYASEYDRHRLKFPIPSFYTYMQLDGDRVKFKNEMRKQIISHAHLWTGESADEKDLRH